MRMPGPSSSRSRATSDTGRYVREFNLAYRYYPRREKMLRWIGGRLHTEEMLADPKVLAGFGLNQREVRVPRRRIRSGIWRLSTTGRISTASATSTVLSTPGWTRSTRCRPTELFTKDGASPAALGFIGGRGSALQAVWHAAILKLRGVPLWPPQVYRLVGGNQTLTDTFATRAGRARAARIAGDRIEHGASGVRVSYRARGEARRLEADYLVSAISAVMLRAIPVTPGVARGQGVRAAQRALLFRLARDLPDRVEVLGEGRRQSEHGDQRGRAAARVEHVRRSRRRRGACSSARPPAPAHRRRRWTSYRKHYTGASEDIEKAQVHVWIKNPWASACETTSYPVGQLAKFWPALFEPRRPRALRGRLRRQSELGHGSRDPVGQSRRRSHRRLRRRGAEAEVSGIADGTGPPMATATTDRVTRGFAARRADR